MLIGNLELKWKVKEAKTYKVQHCNHKLGLSCLTELQSLCHRTLPDSDTSPLCWIRPLYLVWTDGGGSFTLHLSGFSTEQTSKNRPAISHQQQQRRVIYRLFIPQLSVPPEVWNHFYRCMHGTAFGGGSKTTFVRHCLHLNFSNFSPIVRKDN